MPKLADRPLAVLIVWYVSNPKMMTIISFRYLIILAALVYLLNAFSLGTWRR